MLLDKVRDTVKKYALVDYGDKVICAVSGGADSVCMLHAMLALRAEYNLTLYIANVNHLLRGEESDDDSEFVKIIARAADIKLFYREYDVHKIAKERKLGEEECGRCLRYEFFQEIANELGGAKIATAHNLNDNAETVLFRLVRGTASRGLSGIKHKRDNVIRPLLDVSRTEIERYLKSNSITWCEDSTNKLPVYSRNKIRLGVIPVLNEISPSAEEKIVSAARFISEDDGFLNACADVLMKDCFDGESLILDSFNTSPMPLRRRIASKVLDIWGVKEISAEKIEDFLRFLQKENGKMFDLNAQFYARKAYGKAVKSDRNRGYEFDGIIDIDSPMITDRWKLQVFMSDTPVKKNGNDMAVFDAEKLFPPFDVSQKKDGDKMKIKGMKGTKKLSDIFTDAKISTDLRGKLPVVRKNGEVLFVGGLRQTALFSPDENTKKWIVIKYERRDIDYD